MYKNILVPYDFGNSFKNVPEQLEKLTKDSGEDATITVFNVISERELESYVKYQGKHFEDLTADKEKDLAPFYEGLDAVGLKYETKFKTGRATREIINEINAGDYEIVLMSNQRSERDIKHVLGHVTHKVAKRVNIPVLIVK